MKLKYTGPKEVVAVNGVSFKSGKEDKYVYIHSAMQIFTALHHPYQKEKLYSQEIVDYEEDDDTILESILKAKPGLKELCKSELKSFKYFLKQEVDDIKKESELNKAEKDSLKNNMELMIDYRVQRKTNRIIYEHIIEFIVDEIYEHHIKEINTPFNERFWHILQTIQGELSHHNKRSIGSKIETVHNGQIITVCLKINPIA